MVRSTCAMMTSLGLLGACQGSAREPQLPPPAGSNSAPAASPSSLASVAPPASAAPAAPSSAPSSAPGVVASSAPPLATPAAAEPEGARLAMFIARALRAPQKPSAADDGSLANLRKDISPHSDEMDQRRLSNCGASANHADALRSQRPGADSVFDSTPETVQVGLAPHPGMTTVEQQQALVAIRRMTRAVSMCLTPLARTNAKVLGAQIRVGATTTGDGSPPVLTILPTGTADDVKTCVSGALAPLLVGDTTHTQLLFDVRIDKTPK